MQKFNLALVCTDKEQEALLCRLSQRLAQTAPSTYVLGVNSLPHVTICQFVAEQQALAEIWARVALLASLPVLKPTHFYWALNSKKEHGHHFAGIGLDKPDQLLSLQSQIITALQPQQPATPHGAQYQPHFTLGCIDLTPQPNLVELWQTEPQLQETEFKFQLALGRCGPDGQFEQTLFQNEQPV